MRYHPPQAAGRYLCPRNTRLISLLQVSRCARGFRPLAKALEVSSHTNSACDFPNSSCIILQTYYSFLSNKTKRLHVLHSNFDTLARSQQRGNTLTGPGRKVRPATSKLATLCRCWKPNLNEPCCETTCILHVFLFPRVSLQRLSLALHPTTACCRCLRYSTDSNKCIPPATTTCAGQPSTRKKNNLKLNQSKITCPAAPPPSPPFRGDMPSPVMKNQE